MIGIVSYEYPKPRSSARRLRDDSENATGRDPQVIGAGVARGVRRGLRLASAAGVTRHAGCAIRQAVMACAKSAEARLRGGGRWWRRKAATFERGAWATGGEVGAASGEAGQACGWRAAWSGPRDASADLEIP